MNHLLENRFLFGFHFRRDSDPRLENLAEISGGKTYFVKDGSGLEDINGVFENIQTFQPTVPSIEAEIMVHSFFMMLSPETFHFLNFDFTDYARNIPKCCQ